MTTTSLNGPLESGLRVLALLTAWHPDSIDLSRLVLLDYCMLHSSDFGGPPSLHPKLSTRSGELGIKRTVIESGLHVMIRVGLAKMSAERTGIVFSATENAGPFFRLLTTNYSRKLVDCAHWTREHFAELSEDNFRLKMDNLVGSWEPEFTSDNDLGRLL